MPHRISQRRGKESTLEKKKEKEGKKRLSLPFFGRRRGEKRRSTSPHTLLITCAHKGERCGRRREDFNSPRTCIEWKRQKEKEDHFLQAREETGKKKGEKSAAASSSYGGRKKKARSRGSAAEAQEGSKTAEGGREFAGKKKRKRAFSPTSPIRMTSQRGEGVASGGGKMVPP